MCGHSSSLELSPRSFLSSSFSPHLVRVVLQGQLAVQFLEVVLRRVLVRAQDLVVPVAVALGAPGHVHARHPSHPRSERDAAEPTAKHAATAVAVLPSCCCVG